ncbi:MAG: hypothetical protein M3P43_05870, partial [Actinomycetota bacterium]|nr:hypothetical protein [Actinomycetota bacterium]
MKEFDRELREMFKRRAADVLVPLPPSATVTRRTRRRQLGVVIVAMLVVATVVLVPVLVLRMRVGGSSTLEPTNAVVLPEAPPGFEAAALPYASIAYPKGWYLLDTSPLTSTGPPQPVGQLSSPILQLANFDPDLPHAPRCMVDPDSIPSSGVLLTIGVMSPEEASLYPPSGTWPAQLAPYPSGVDPVCAQGRELASWTGASGAVYWAQAGWGAGASQADIDAMHRAFESLLLPPSDQPWLDGMAAFQGQGTPRVVLGTTTFGNDVLTFVAYLELNKTLWVGVESNGSWTSATAPHTGSDPNPPISAGLTVVGQQAALLDGTISPEVARVEVRTDAGDVVPMNVLPLPPSLGTDDRYVWALVPNAGDGSTVVGYDAHGDPIGDPSYPVSPNQEIAHGTEAGQVWKLELTHDNTGWGLSFSYGDGSGGGGGTDLGNAIFGSSSSGGPSWNIDTGWSTAPRDLEGDVTSRAARVDYELVEGRTIGASLYPLPADAFGGGAQAYVVFVPNDVLIQAGDLIAYDAQGNELGRQYLDLSPVALFPKVLEASSPEAVDAMKALQLAGAVAARYFYDHDSWEGFDPTSAARISNAVTYNTSSTAMVGQVSLRVAGKDSLVLATKISNGEVYSACLQQGPGGAMEGR